MAESTSETNNIESKAPAEQELREIGSGVSDTATLETNIAENNLTKINLAKTSDEENAEAAKDDSVYSPVITITKEEATFTKGDLKLQKVIVSEDISDESTTINRTLSITEARGPNEMHTEICSNMQSVITTSMNDNKENTEDGEKRSFKTTSKIPKLKFKQAIERIKRQQRMINNNVSRELVPEPKLVHSGIPRLKDLKNPTHDTQTDKTQQEVESPKLDEEFDKLYEEILEKEASDDVPSPEKISDPIKLESRFEEIIHAYDKDNSQPKSIEKVKSKIPLLKRKSETEIEIPPPTYRRSLLKKSNSYDLKDTNPSAINKEKSLKSDIKSLKHACNAKNTAQETITSSETKSQTVSAHVFESFETTTTIKTITTQQSSEMIELINVTSTNNNTLDEKENFNVVTTNKTLNYQNLSDKNSEASKKSDVTSTTIIKCLPRITNRNDNIIDKKVEQTNMSSDDPFQVDAISKNDVKGVFNTNSVYDETIETHPESVSQTDQKLVCDTNNVIKVEEFSKIKDDIETITSNTIKSVNITSENDVKISSENNNKQYLDVSDIRSITLDVIKSSKTNKQTNDLKAYDSEEGFDLNPVEFVDMSFPNKKETSENDSHNFKNNLSETVTIDNSDSKQTKTFLQADHKPLPQINETFKVKEFSYSKDYQIIESKTVSKENIAVQNENENIFDNNFSTQISSETENRPCLDISDTKSVTTNEIENLKTEGVASRTFIDPLNINQEQPKETRKNDYSTTYLNKNWQSSNNDSSFFSNEKTTVHITKVDYNETRTTQNETAKISKSWNDKQDDTGFVCKATTGTSSKEQVHTDRTENIINKIEVEDKENSKHQEKINKFNHESKQINVDSKKCDIGPITKVLSLDSIEMSSVNKYNFKGQSPTIGSTIKDMLTLTRGRNEKVGILRCEENSKQRSVVEKEKHAVSWSESKNVYVKESSISSGKISANNQINSGNAVKNNILENELETINKTGQFIEGSSFKMENTDAIDEEDIIILKGKVSRIKRRLDSYESKASKKEIDDVPKEVSVISKIAIFEQNSNESLNAVPQKREINIETSAAISDKPKVVKEILKSSTNDQDTNNREKNINKETVVQDSLKNNYNKDIKLENLVKNEHQQETKFIANEGFEGYTNTITKKYFDIVKVSKTESVTQLKAEVNETCTIKEKFVLNKMEENNDVFIKKEGEMSSLDVWNHYKMRKELDSDVRRAKSLAELDVRDSVKGRVRQMVVRLNSIERMSMSRREIIDLREKPRMGSVSKRIALFERKLVPIRGEDEYIPRSTSQPSSDISESVNEEELKKKIEELTDAKTKYGKMNMTYMELGDGSQMPVLAVGTAMLEPKLLKHIVHAAIDLGYRGFDTAYIYGNERELGRAIRDKIHDGTVKREDLYIISKLWSTFHRRDLAEKACRNSLQEMGLDYFDLYLIHNPMSLKEGTNPLPKIANVLQYSEHDYLDAWYGIENLIRKGLVKRGGVSNFNSVQVERIIEKGKIKPVINQVECHPYLSQSRLDDFCGARNVKLSCYSVLGSSGTPPQWKSTLPPVLDDPLVRVMAAGLGVSPAQLLISYQLHLGHHVVVKSSSGKHLWDNLQALALKLDHSQIAALNALNKNKRAFAFKGMGDTHKNYPFKIAF